MKMSKEIYVKPTIWVFPTHIEPCLLAGSLGEKEEEPSFEPDDQRDHAD